MDEVVEVQPWLQIPRLCLLIGSENFAVMLAAWPTPIAPLGGTVLTTVGAPAVAAQAIPEAKSSARAIVVNSSSVFLMIFLSPP